MEFKALQGVRAKLTFAVKQVGTVGNVFPVIENGEYGYISSVQGEEIFVVFRGDIDFLTTKLEKEIVAVFDKNTAALYLQVFKVDYTVGDTLTVKIPFEMAAVVKGEVNDIAFSREDESVEIVEVDKARKDAYKINLLDRTIQGGEYEAWMTLEELKEKFWQDEV